MKAKTKVRFGGSQKMTWRATSQSRQQRLKVRTGVKAGMVIQGTVKGKIQL